MTDTSTAGEAGYGFRAEHGAWTIYEAGTGQPAVLNGAPLTGLSLEEADDLAAALNRAQHLVSAIDYGGED